MSRRGEGMRSGSRVKYPQPWFSYATRAHVAATCAAEARMGSRPTSVPTASALGFEEAAHARTARGIINSMLLRWVWIAFWGDNAYLSRERGWTPIGWRLEARAVVLQVRGSADIFGVQSFEAHGVVRVVGSASTSG